MNVHGKPTRTIWPVEDGVEIIDQTALPHAFVTRRLSSVEEAARAIAGMQVRGAPLIGATAAYGLWLAARADPSDAALAAASAALLSTRPTAVNLRWALEMVTARLAPLPPAARAAAARAAADAIADDDVAMNRAIGDHTLPLVRAAGARRRDSAPIQILTHCNAGWLATVDRGTALAGVYAAHDAGVPLHVWVDETRPRNQGAALTAWELGQHGIAHTVIADNAGGHLMQRGLVDLCLVGSDRTTARGDVANKIGTYLKALAAHDNDIPFYAALPSSTIDWDLEDPALIPIERRDPREVTHIEGWCETGQRLTVRVTPRDSPAENYAFDVTPARLVTALITERGICPASREGLLALFPERG